MQLLFNQLLWSNYTSIPKKIWIMSEDWTEKNIFCPNCGNAIRNLENNKKVSDFLCEKCRENFEQKASKTEFKNKVISSEYFTLIERLKSDTKPHFFFLHYLEANYKVNNFFVVPKYFFVPEIIEKRKPLSENARRAGWTGSNILFSKIPEVAKIFYVQNGDIKEKNEVLKKWEKINFFKEVKQTKSKGWILDIMNIIDSFNKKEFTLEEVYAFENDLKLLHPENNNIKPKIRQQLQFLRDKGYLEFLEKGRYRVL